VFPPNFLAMPPKKYRYHTPSDEVEYPLLSEATLKSFEDFGGWAARGTVTNAQRDGAILMLQKTGLSPLPFSRRGVRLC